MSEALEHRGPDAEGAFFGPSVALGSRRLSIVDVAGGAQPMSAAGNEVVIVFNGEIYNHLELREELRGGGHGFRTSSDTETILQLYLSKGVACLPRLNGMFAFAIWDKRSHTLLIARDSVGIKPLFLQRTSHQLRFASEIKGLLADSALPRQMNGNGLGSFFRYGSIGDNGTAFEGIEQLAPGHYLLVREGGGGYRYRFVPRIGISASATVWAMARAKASSAPGSSSSSRASWPTGAGGGSSSEHCHSR